ncbi:MAG: hypothetical protein WDZ62_02150 [Candidatus Pacearchaeota archaeon]
MEKSGIDGFWEGYIQRKLEINGPTMEVYLGEIRIFCETYDVKKYLPENNPKELSDLEKWISLAVDLDNRISLDKINPEPKKMDLANLLDNYHSFSEICDYGPLKKSVNDLIGSAYEKIIGKSIPEIV